MGMSLLFISLKHIIGHRDCNAIYLAQTYWSWRLLYLPLPNIVVMGAAICIPLANILVGAAILTFLKHIGHGSCNTYPLANILGMGVAMHTSIKHIGDGGCNTYL